MPQSVAARSVDPAALEYAACPLCGGMSHRRLFQRRDYTHLVTDHPFDIVRCRNCSFVFVNPRPTRSAIAAYYPDEFYDVNATPQSLLEEKRETLAARVALLGSLKAGRLLDVGCQKGEFMWMMRERGWDVHGVEFSSVPPNVFGLPIVYSTLDDAPFDRSSFDLVTLWAVLEHIHDPVGMLKRVHRLLKPTGRAFVLVPNFNSIPARLMRHDDVPRHLVMFTKKTLRRAARHAGFAIDRFVFGDDIFSGSTRGTLNFLWKLLHGERIDDIVAQNRTPGRWTEFSSLLRGKPDKGMLRVDALDMKVAPRLNKLVNALHLGFIMTAELRPLER